MLIQFSLPVFSALASFFVAFATTFAPRTFPVAVKDAPIIVRGEVGASYSNWGISGDGAKRLYTYSELNLKEVMKGNITGSSIQMRELGGKKDGVGLEVPGSAQFKRGEDIVVFLSPKNSDGSFDVRGMMMGKYEVTLNAQSEEILTGGELSQNFHSDHPENEHSTPDVERKDTDQPSKQWSISSLKELIQSQSYSNQVEENKGIVPTPKEQEKIAVPMKPTVYPSAPTLKDNEESKAPQDGRSKAPWVGLVALLGLALAVISIRAFRS